MGKLRGPRLWLGWGSELEEGSLCVEKQRQTTAWEPGAPESAKCPQLSLTASLTAPPDVLCSGPGYV